MVKVTARIKEIQQPRGGYLPPKSFLVKQLENKSALAATENIHPSLIGLAVDYMTRAISSGNIENAFSISLRGAALIGEMAHARSLLKKLEPFIAATGKTPNLWHDAVTAACQLSGYDVCFRAGSALYTKPVQDIAPDKDTINNVKLMVERSMSFFAQYGPVVQDGVIFSFEAFSSVVTSGDGDFATADTLWDFKVSKAEPTKDHTLQLLMYWIMGQRCNGAKFAYFKNLTRLGVFNPRLNKVYTLDISDISPQIIQEVENDVLCYE
ncbi:MAG: hypothetical protein DU429_09060 [Candidatus Tokpelaia sp.]|nr:MAG: hypothetical protein DU429_09060 [Candidatus Tokpelaia sp.]KAA6206535.1 MAG: hypothetical protein DU430_00085 [Candidatus Tokpelaia sp.]